MFVPLKLDEKSKKERCFRGWQVNCMAITVNSLMALNNNSFQYKQNSSKTGSTWVNNEYDNDWSEK